MQLVTYRGNSTVGRQTLYRGSGGSNSLAAVSQFAQFCYDLQVAPFGDNIALLFFFNKI